VEVLHPGRRVNVNGVSMIVTDESGIGRGL
jgi:hypothetical protein